MFNNWVNFWFSIMKKLWDFAHENLDNIQGSPGVFGSIFMDVSHTLDMAFYKQN